ncbi:DNA polymerase III subunit delta' [Candidatus Avelusimicrobium luingense]|uniref:DNA polymerase III subunit delta' n=1 Tax=Candidatus Avelusimicrobium luingense TaxID=3416211 RepID=UPI003D0F471E
MPFSEILGQEKATDYLKTLVKNERVPGALLFYGPAGVGKAKTALEFAKALNCLDATARAQGEACGECANCKAISQQIHPDVIFADFLYQARLTVKKDFESSSYEEELEKELAKQQHINIDTIRDVTAKAQQKAVGNGYKVFIIDEAQSMQGAAANALLKFIEEPPAKTVWILITSKRSAMLRTILSRCQSLAFAPLSQENIKQILQDNQLDTQYTDLCAKYSCGSIQGALKADGALALLQEAGISATGCSPQGPAAVVAELPRTLVASRQETQAVLDVLLQALHSAWVSAPTDNEQRRYTHILQQFENYKRSLTRNVSPALVLETALCSLDGLNLPLFETEN